MFSKNAYLGDGLAYLDDGHDDCDDDGDDGDFFENIYS